MIVLVLLLLALGGLALEAKRQERSRQYNNRPINRGWTYGPGQPKLPRWARRRM